MKTARTCFIMRLVLIRHLAECRAWEHYQLGEPCLAYDLDMYVDPVWFTWLNGYLENHD